MLPGEAHDHPTSLDKFPSWHLNSLKLICTDLSSILPSAGIQFGLHIYHSTKTYTPTTKREKKKIMMIIISSKYIIHSSGLICKLIKIKIIALITSKLAISWVLCLGMPATSLE